MTPARRSSTDHRASQSEHINGQGGYQIPTPAGGYTVELGDRNFMVYLNISPADIRTFPQPTVFTIVDTGNQSAPQSGCICTTRNAQGIASDPNGSLCRCGQANPTHSALNNIVSRRTIGPSRIVARDNEISSSIVATTGASSSSLSPSFQAPPANAPGGTPQGHVPPPGQSMSLHMSNVPLNTIPDILDIESYRGMLPIARRTGPTDTEYEDFEIDEDNYYFSDSDYDDDDYNDAYDADDDLTFEEHLEMGDGPGSLNEEEINDRMKVCVYRFTRSKLNWNTIECCICQEEYSNNERLGELDCTHKFHYECIERWLMLNNTCPICKQIGLRAPN